MRRQLAIAALCAFDPDDAIVGSDAWLFESGGWAAPHFLPTFRGFRGSAGFSRPNFGSRSTHFSTTFGTGFRRPFNGSSGRFHRRFFLSYFSPYFYGYSDIRTIRITRNPPFDSYPGMTMPPTLLAAAKTLMI